MQRRTFLALATQAAAQPASQPWYRKAYRWGQTNITENDPLTYDIPWWRAHWKRTETQAVIINAGGIVAYYPSKFPLHYQAQFLNGRDLYGELTKAAHDDGIYVMARMDSNRTAENFYQAHPDWFTRDRNGNPCRAALILHNIAALSNQQCAALKTYVAQGGSLLATGATSLYDEYGDPRPDYGLAEIFGIHRITNPPTIRRTDIHTYLRLQSNIIPYGGELTPIRTDPGATIPLTFIPEFPTYPPETSWMRTPRTDIPALILRQQNKSRLAFLTADIDRRYARLHLTDHADLLKNIIHWIAADTIPVTIEGPGFLDTHLYRQGNTHILHIINLTKSNSRAPQTPQHS